MMLPQHACSIAADLRRLAKGMAGVERGDIGFGEFGRLGELGLQPLDDWRARAVEHPERETQRPHILAAQRLLVTEAEGLHGIHGELRDVERHQLPAAEAAVGQRMGALRIACLGQVAGGELALVGDDQAARLERLDIHLERCRVHRDEHVGLVAGRLDRGRSEVDLERRDAEGRALRRADLGGEIGKCGEVVAGQGRRQGELATRQLHTVAGVAREADDDRFRRRVR